MVPTQLPHRKPIPGHNAPPPRQQSGLAPSFQQARFPPPDQRTYTSTSQMNTVSSSMAPAIPPMSAERTNTMYSMQSQAPPHQFQSYQQQQQHYSQPPQHYPQPRSGQQQPHQLQQPYPPANSRRTLSNATTSSSASLGLQRAPTGTSFTNGGGPPRRSTSSRSNSSTASPTSYVALMRKQKATVWCDRAQQQDPRSLAAQRALKMRALKEVAGSRTSTGSGSYAPAYGGSGGLRSKIRHHGAVKASTYAGGANLSGAGVPMRLSASEVDDDNDSDDDDSKYMNYHSRGGAGTANGTGAGGSFGSRSKSAAAALAQQQLQQQRAAGLANGSNLSAGQSPEEEDEGEHDDDDNDHDATAYEDETPMPSRHDAHALDYFAHRGGRGGGSGGSGGTDEEERFGGVGDMHGPPAAAKHWSAEQDRKTSEELRRRGSVDDRAMTMNGPRLFVANPDLSD